MLCYWSESVWVVPPNTLALVTAAKQYKADIILKMGSPVQYLKRGGGVIIIKYYVEHSFDNLY